MATFQDFQHVLAELETLKRVFRSRERELNEELNASLTADFKKKFPRRKYTLARFPDCPNGPAILAQYKALANEWYRQTYKPTFDALETQLNTIARECLPDHTAEMNLVHRVYASAYASQGYGCEKYTRQSAENAAKVARNQGFKAEVRPVGQYFRDQYGITYQDYGVFCDCSAMGWDLLRRKPAMSLREWIKDCWRRGTNPRVYDPFLPYGIEARLGLDEFGNDLTPAA